MITMGVAISATASASTRDRDHIAASANASPRSSAQVSPLITRIKSTAVFVYKTSEGSPTIA